jgi:CxxC motif-containing protein (DUF1111 family)
MKARYILLALVLLIAACVVKPVVMPAPQPKIGEPLAGLTPDLLDRFDRGKKIFMTKFVTENGLGPFFNNDGCASCHEIPVVGGAGGFDREPGDIGADIERHVTKGDQPKCDELESVGGPVLRLFTTGPPLPMIPADGDVNIAQRTTPPIFGFGLIDAIPDQAILANEGRHGGRAAKLANGRIGRFGRKATDSNLADFIAGAFLKESGHEIPSELSLADRDITVDFVRFLAPPARLGGQFRGEAIFNALQCTQCHHPTFTTSSLIPALDRKVVAAYSDFLLHDMGESQDICKGVARRNEFRTEPLMGLRTRVRFLHDGRALTLTSAIAQHGGQGQAAADAFQRLSNADQRRLLAFLQSL